MQEKYFSSQNLKVGIAQGGDESCYRYLWRRLQGVSEAPGPVQDQLQHAFKDKCGLFSVCVTTEAENGPLVLGMEMVFPHQGH